MKALASQAGQACHCPRCGAAATVPGGTVPAKPEPAPSRKPAARSPVTSDPRPNRNPVQADPAPVQEPPPRPKPARRPRVQVRCPLCRSPLAVFEEQLGTAVKCLDCHTEFEAVVKQSPAARRKAPSHDEGDIALSEPISTPRYIPFQAEGVTAAELYGPQQEDRLATTAPVKPREITEPQFAVVCPLCHTRLYVTHRQMGTLVRCGDCHSEFAVEAPREAPQPARFQVEDADVEFGLEEVAERPKYQPLTRGEVTREQLDELERRAESYPELEEKPAAPASSKAPAFDFEVVCRHCGSRIPARESQIGQKIQCNDCHSQLMVVRPRRKRAPARASEPEGPAITIADSPAEAARTSEGIASLRWLSQAEAEEESREPARIKLASLPYPKQLFGFLIEPATLLRIAGLSVGLMLLFWLTTRIIIYANAGLAAVIAVVMICFHVFVLVPTALFWANSAIAIVTETGSGNASIEEWSEVDFIDWMVQAAMLIFAGLICAIPAAMLAGALSIVSESPWIALGCLALSITIFFPPILLSMLLSGSFFHVYTQEVWSTLGEAPGVWMRLYVTTAAIFACGLGVSLLATRSLMLAAGSAVVLVALSFLYFRAIGIAADCSGSLETNEE